MVHSGILYISERRQGPQNVAGGAVAYPLLHPLNRHDGQAVRHNTVDLP